MLVSIRVFLFSIAFNYMLELARSVPMMATNMIAAEGPLTDSTEAHIKEININLAYLAFTMPRR